MRGGLGLDLSLGMLQRGQPKLAAAGGCPLALVHGDAQRLPLRSAGVAVATISFGIRNVADLAAGLAELHRVLRPGGHLFILEFGLPANRLLRRLYLLYFRHVLPRLGGLLSGDPQAYRYLNQTVETFPYGEAFCAHLRAAGFAAVTATPMTFGVVYLYQGQRPAP
jgi:demethylmenaquinone methyltransferase/2-methoxy-6-polyprenyl-1,4-benzoquinol methylase